MRRPRCLRATALGLGWFIVSLGVVAVPTSAQEWIRVTTPGFVVYSDAGGRDATRVASELEVVKAIFQSAFGSTRIEAHRPVVVIALDDRDDLQHWLPSLRETRGVQGAFRSGSLEHHIVLTTDGGGRDRFQVVYHEFFHLLSNLSGHRLPPWLEEGLAELYSNLTVRGDRVELGDRRVDYLDFLARERLIPLQELVSAEADPHLGDRFQATRFYAQAWALVHLIMLGDGTGQGSRQIDAYINQVTAGADAIEAFESIIGPLDDVERDLNRYLRRDSFYGFRLPTPQNLDAGAFSVEELSPAEALSIHARVLAQGVYPTLAESLLDEALALEPDLPLAHETRGLMQLFQGAPAESARSFARAIELGTEHYVSHYGAALLTVQAGEMRERRDEIEGLLRRALELQPRFAPASMLLAGVLADQDSPPPEAVDLAQRAVQLEPWEIQHWVTLGDVLLASNRVAEARSVVIQAVSWVRSATEQAYVDELRARTRDPDATLARASVHRAENRLGDAEASYRAAILIDDTDARGHVGLGQTLADLDRTDEAIRAFERALSIDPSNRVALSALGALLAEAGRPEEATATLRRAVSLGGGDARASRNVGVTLLQQGQFASAAAAFRESLALDPSQPDTLHNLGWALMQGDELEAAVEAYRRSIALRSDYPPAHFNLGTALLRLDAPAEAASAYRRGLELNPTYARGHHGLGLALLRQDEPDAAERAFREAISNDARYAPPYEALGRVLAARGDVEGALTAFRQAIELNAAFVAAHANLGLLLARQGETDAAVAQFQMVTRLDPDGAQGFRMLAQALDELGQTEAANEARTRAEALDAER